MVFIDKTIVQVVFIDEMVVGTIYMPISTEG